jgi:glucan phosphoethanolaminetransferase (alkaline phosphatase superfamily)
MESAQNNDPVTGDSLTRSEWLSWNLQAYVIRTWWFLIGFTFITLTCIWLGVVTANPSYATNWNYLASYMAIFVEAIVGRAMFSQTRRDAVLIREIKKLMHELKKLQQVDAEHSKADYEVSLDVNHKLNELLEIFHDGEETEYLEQWYGEYNE